MTERNVGIIASDVMILFQINPGAFEKLFQIDPLANEQVIRIATQRQLDAAEATIAEMEPRPAEDAPDTKD